MEGLGIVFGTVLPGDQPHIYQLNLIFSKHLKLKVARGEIYKHACFQRYPTLANSS